MVEINPVMAKTIAMMITAKRVSFMSLPQSISLASWAFAGSDT